MGTSDDANDDDQHYGGADAQLHTPDPHHYLLHFVELVREPLIHFFIHYHSICVSLIVINIYLQPILILYALEIPSNIISYHIRYNS